MFLKRNYKDNQVTYKIRRIIATKLSFDSSISCIRYERFNNQIKSLHYAYIFIYVLAKRSKAAIKLKLRTKFCFKICKVTF